MAKIFISYRRKDSAGVAGRIYDRLRQYFGDNAVFMDIDTIPFGDDFREHIRAAMSQCDVVLAVMGSRWTGRTKTRRKIDDPKDFLRIELEAALERNLPVIPILIDDTRMPAEADLPASLSQLAYRNAVEIDQGRDFHPHVDRLIRGIEFQFRRVNQLTNSVGMALIRIEPGEFSMGTTKDQVGKLMRQFPDSKRESFVDEQPQHLVKIAQPFFLGIHAVTQRQYQAVMGSNPSDFKGVDERPVETVSWVDAVEFCNKLSGREKQKPYYQINGADIAVAGGSGYRLPTEAEWEYACRAGTLSLYPFDDEASQLAEHAWYSGNAKKSTHPVGQKRPNSWGLYDMLGNVWEWCADWYDPKYYASSPILNPIGDVVASRRIMRGGCWNGGRRMCRSAIRGRGAVLMAGNFLGFRVARGEG
jgi:formylglycine-generating enzyme required for sulfatase activity